MSTPLDRQLFKKYRGIWRGPRGSPRGRRVIDVDLGGRLVVHDDLRRRVDLDGYGKRVTSAEFDRWVVTACAKRT